MNLLEFLGKFHPLAVHLPIGILTIFIVLGLFISRKKLLDSLAIIRLILLVSALSATFSSISGFLLSNADSYDLQLVSFHQWSGFSLTILNWLLYFKIEYLLDASIRIYRISLVVILLGLIVTGHAGGSLTHGSDFLNPPPPNQWFSSKIVEKKEISLNTAAFEASSILLEKKCFVCHGKNKQKGKLRLDTKEAMLKGGENGKIISEDATNSLLMERLLLPLDDEDHMPPKEKKQLSESEISFLTWWIESGADFDKTLGELNLPDSLHEILSKEEIEIVDNTIPKEEIDPAEIQVLEKLKSLNVVITPLGLNSNYLSASFVNVLPEDIADALNSLIKINSQLVWLNLDYQNLEEDCWKKISHLTNLRKLSVRSSNFDDEKLAIFQSMDNLVYLNLVSTNITFSGLLQVRNSANLESLYLYQTNVEKADFEKIKEFFPNTQIDTGNYFVPILESDTTVLTLQ